MGFKVGRTFTLEFAGTDLAGAEVRFRSASVGDLTYYNSEIVTKTEEADWAAGFLISWDLVTEDHEGTEHPLPANANGLLALEEPAYNLIINEWLKATRGVTAPLDHRSVSGGSSPKPESAPIPMETL